jgi:uncharacterized delta-60 repeat protein
VADNFLKISKGTTYKSQSVVPNNPVNGDVYYDSNLESFQFYQDGKWFGLGDLEPVEFTVANNQNSAQDITGLVVDSSENYAFSLDYSLRRVTDRALAEDTAFYNNLGTAFNNQVLATTFQSDGKVLVGGFFNSFNSNTRNYLVRLNEDGTEDTAFYTNLGAAFNSIVLSIHVQADGKILVGGDFTSFNSNTRIGLVRLNQDGTEDTAFYTNLGGSFFGSVETIMTQPDGKILVGGAFTSFNSNTRNYLVRLNEDGTEDTAFYTNMGTAFNSSIAKLVLQADGKILVGGAFTSFNSTSAGRFLRLNPSGTLDTAFLTNLGTGSSGEIYGIAVQSDDKILVGGTFTTFNSNTRNRLVRLNEDGTEDTTFYTNLGTGFNTIVFSLTIQEDQKIIVGGLFDQLNSNTRNRIARLNQDGTEDVAFYNVLSPAFTTGSIAAADLRNSELVLVGTFTNFNSNTRNRFVKLSLDVFEERIRVGRLSGFYKAQPDEWILGAENFAGDETGVGLSITSAGQLQYTSDEMITPHTGTLKYKLNKL